MGYVRQVFCQLEDQRKPIHTFHEEASDEFPGGFEAEREPLFGFRFSAAFSRLKNQCVWL